MAWNWDFITFPWNRFVLWPERVAARFLVRRGWVVFWLEEPMRHCSPMPGGCWLQLWEEDRQRHLREGGPF